MASPDRASRTLHPELTAAARAELLARGIALFNRGDYFAAHEAWEEIWRSTTPAPRELFQGLVLVAASFHHLTCRHRPDVAQRVLAKGLRRLSTVHADEAEGIALQALLDELNRWESHLKATPDVPWPLPQIEIGPAAS
jgi:predicted metal-dependent hydrolase